MDDRFHQMPPLQQRLHILKRGMVPLGLQVILGRMGHQHVDLGVIRIIRGMEVVVQQILRLPLVADPLL